MIRRRSAVWAGVVIAIVVAAALGVRLFGVSVYRIKTGSMAPVYPVGTVIVDSRLLAPAVGLPLTFRTEDGTVTHVLVGYGSDGRLLTRGLANPSNDVWTPPVYTRDVRGRVVLAVLVGAPSFWLSVRGAAFAVGMICLILAYTAIRSSASSRTGFSA